MAKNTSTWIDNSKVRNEIYSFNQAVKQVYDGYRFTSDGIIVPSSVEAIKAPTVFDKSIFFHSKYETPFPFLEESVIYPDELNKALKDKCTEYSIMNGKHYLKGNDKSGKELIYETGAPMTDFQKKDTPNYKGLLEFYKLSDIEPISTYTLTDDDTEKILAYEVLEKDIGEYEGNPIHIIVSKELFPVIKKVDMISICVYIYDGLPPNIYEISIKSIAPTWNFYSMHYILS